MIYKAKIKTIFPLLNLAESKANGLDNLILDLEQNSGMINLPIEYFGEAPLKFNFSKLAKPNDFGEE